MNDALIALARSWLMADPGRGYMAIFYAYFDDSGTRGDSDSLTVAGFIASVEQWDAFRSEWEGAMKDFGVSHLHMKDFAHSTGEFSGWETQEHKRREFLNRLVSIIGRRVRHSFSATILLEDYESFNEVYPLDEEQGGPFALCVGLTLEQVDAWKKRHLTTSDVVKFVYEDGATGKGFVIDHFGRANDIAFMKKGEHPALEAADFAAYEHTKAYRMEVSGKLGEIRKSLGLLRDRVPQTWEVADNHALTRAAESAGLQKRL